MVIKSLKYTRFKGEKNEWSIEGRPVNGSYNQFLTFEDINLIVGKNASGKSKTIDVLRLIADVICNETKLSEVSLMYTTAEYNLIFDNEGKKIEYILFIKDGKVLEENLIIDGETKLNRAEGKLFYEVIGENLDFQTDDDILAVSKRDKKQHPFFENLYLWGKNLTHYRFGQNLGKLNFLRDANTINYSEEPSFKNANKVAEVFTKGVQKFKTKFANTIIKDMKEISYNLNEIKVGELKYLPYSFLGINVQENDLEDTTNQIEMSQGMFRALSLLIQLNYSLMSNITSCILIDDIGEGLDYDRSKSLINLIINKVQRSSEDGNNHNVQVIMTTNDRFVMNSVPLRYWSVIGRHSKKSLFYNYANSKETFDDFSLTKLNNFEFYSTEFFEKGFENYIIDKKVKK